MKEDQESKSEEQLLPDLFHPMAFPFPTLTPFVDYLLILFFSFVPFVYHCCKNPLEQKLRHLTILAKNDCKFFTSMVTRQPKERKV